MTRPYVYHDSFKRVTELFHMSESPRRVVSVCMFLRVRHFCAHAAQPTLPTHPPTHPIQTPATTTHCNTHCNTNCKTHCNRRPSYEADPNPATTCSAIVSPTVKSTPRNTLQHAMQHSAPHCNTNNNTLQHTLQHTTHTHCILGVCDTYFRAKNRMELIYIPSTPRNTLQYNATNCNTTASNISTTLSAPHRNTHQHTPRRVRYRFPSQGSYGDYLHPTPPPQYTITKHTARHCNTR